MEIRKALKEEYVDILRLQYLFASPFKEKDVLYEFNENPVSEIYVAVIDNRVVGYIDFWITFDSATIAQLAVDIPYQKQGVASQLLKKAFEVLKKENVCFFTLEVRDHNIPAINLYEKNGFKRITIKKGYYTNGDDAIYMVKGIF